MAFQVVHADGRFAQSMGEAGADAGADQQGAGQSRACGIGHGVQFSQFGIALRQYLTGQRQHPADVIAGRQFRHHATVIGVEGDLGMQRMCEQAARCVI